MNESITLPLEEVIELINNAVYEELKGTWRWGTTVFYVFEKDDKFWGVTLKHQPEYGIKDCNFGPIQCDRVMSKKEIVTVTTWVPYIKS